MTPRAVDSAAADASVRTSGAQWWLMALLPLLLLAGLLFVMTKTGPADALRGEGVPPVELLTFQRVELRDDGIVATVLNDGPDPVTIAQVVVDDAYWYFEIDGDRVLDHLDRATLRVPYPWVHGETHHLRIVTASGVTFDHDIAVAVPTPQPGWRFFAVFSLIGLYVGVIPVALGLLWYPMVARLGTRGLDFLLALTVGLLLFLFVDATAEGLDAAEAVPGSYQGVALFVIGAAGAYLGLEALSRWLRGRRGAARHARGSGWVLALLVAIGIGLHNFGEGLAIGAAFSLGEAALGALLIIGFALHNTTEGLAIVAPLAKERPRIGDLVRLGVVAGAPTIAGAWLGGLAYSGALSVLFLGIGAGAIVQVVVQIARQMAGERTVAQHLATAPVLTGLFAGFVIMYATGMLVG